MLVSIFNLLFSELVNTHAYRWSILILIIVQQKTETRIVCFSLLLVLIAFILCSAAFIFIDEIRYPLPVHVMWEFTWNGCKSQNTPLWYMLQNSFVKLCITAGQQFLGHHLCSVTVTQDTLLVHPSSSILGKHHLHFRKQ